MTYLLAALQEPVKVRVHHLAAWKGFLMTGGTEEGELKRVMRSSLYGNASNYGGYGMKFIQFETALLTYLTTNPNTRIRIVSSTDALCESTNPKCPNRKPSCYEPDGDSDYRPAIDYVLYPGKECTSQEVLQSFLYYEKNLVRQMRISTERLNQLQGVIKRLQSTRTPIKSTGK